MKKRIMRDEQPLIVKTVKAMADVLIEDNQLLNRKIKRTAALETASKKMGFANYNRLLGHVKAKIQEFTHSPRSKRSYTDHKTRSELLKNLPLRRILPNERLEPVNVCRHTVAIYRPENKEKMCEIITKWVNNGKAVYCHNSDSLLKAKIRIENENWESKFGPGGTLFVDIETCYEIEGIDVLLAQARSLRIHVVLMFPLNQDIVPYTSLIISNASSIVIDEPSGPLAGFVPSLPWEMVYGTDSGKTSNLLEASINSIFAHVTNAVIVVWSEGGGVGQHIGSNAIADLLGLTRSQILRLFNPNSSGWLGARDDVRSKTGSIIQPLCVSSHEDAFISLQLLPEFLNKKHYSVRVGVFEFGSTYNLWVDVEDENGFISTPLNVAAIEALRHENRFRNVDPDAVFHPLLGE